MIFQEIDFFYTERVYCVYVFSETFFCCIFYSETGLWFFYHFLPYMFLSQIFLDFWEHFSDFFLRIGRGGESRPYPLEFFVAQKNKNGKKKRSQAMASLSPLAQKVHEADSSPALEAQTWVELLYQESPNFSNSIQILSPFLSLLHFYIWNPFLSFISFSHPLPYLP